MVTRDQLQIRIYKFRTLGTNITRSFAKFASHVACKYIATCELKKLKDLCTSIMFIHVHRIYRCSSVSSSHRQLTHYLDSHWASSSSALKPSSQLCSQSCMGTRDQRQIWIYKYGTAGTNVYNMYSIRTLQRDGWKQI